MNDRQDTLETKLAEARAEMAERERDAALGAAAIEAVNREAAQRNAVDAEITASQNAAAVRELNTDRRLLRENLAAERNVSSSNAFGFYLMTGILIAILLVGGIYYSFHRQDIAGEQNITVSSAPPPPTVRYAPPVVNVPTPQVRVDVKAEPSSPQPQTSPNGGTSQSSSPTE